MGGERIEWRLNKMAQSWGRLREGKNWASIIEVKIHDLAEKCEQSCIFVLFRARRGSKPCTECQSLGERRSNFHLVFALIGMIFLRSCPFYPVSMFRPGPLQCSGISAERIMRPSTLVDYCIPGGVVPLSSFGRVKTFIWRTFLVKFCPPVCPNGLMCDH